MPSRFPATNYAPAIRCKGQLAAGTVLALGQVVYEVHAVAGRARVKVRLLVTGIGATLELFFMGPDAELEKAAKAGATYAQLPTYGTIYAAGAPAPVAVAPGVDAQTFADCYGESWVVVKVTAAGATTITACDVMRV